MISLRPTDNEFLRVTIEVLFVKERWVHRVEKLLDSVDEDLDAMRRTMLDLGVANHMVSAFRPSV